MMRVSLPLIILRQERRGSHQRLMRAALLLILLLPSLLRLAFVLRRQRLLYLLLAARGASRLALFVETLEERQLALGLLLLTRARVRDEELVVDARVRVAYARGASQRGDGFVVTASAHEQAAE